MFVVYGAPLGRQNLHDVLFGDGGEYQPGSVDAELAGPDNPRRAPTVVAQRLRDNGWAVAQPVTTPAVGCADSRCEPATLPIQTSLTARRGQDIIEITSYPAAGGAETNVSVSLGRATPWPVYPISLLGGLLGAAAGWLMFGWASRRTERHDQSLQALTKLSYGFAAFLWWLPIGWAAPLALAHHLQQPHFRWHPLWEWLGPPTASLLFLTGDAAALLVLGIAALPQRRRSDTTDVATL
jgi:hypothetical protein